MSIADLFDSEFKSRNKGHFSAIVRVALADGASSSEEKAFLDKLALHLEISPTEYQEILENSTIELIASGGISNIEDVQKMKEIGCAGTIIGKAIYEGRISLEQLSKI